MSTSTLRPVSAAATPTALCATPRDLTSIQRRLDKWELEHLRALAATLHAQLETAEHAAADNERNADSWREHAYELQEELQQLAQETGATLGLTQTGQVLVLRKAGFPTIGQHLAEHGGIYAGIARGIDGEPDAHLVLLDDKPTEELDWDDACKWGESLGNGARLPNLTESALLYANLKDQFEKSWYWTNTQYSALNAWFQGFNYGYQDSFKSSEGRARAVRRLPLESFNSLAGGEQ